MNLKEKRLHRDEDGRISFGRVEALLAAATLIIIVVGWIISISLTGAQVNANTKDIEGLTEDVRQEQVDTAVMQNDIKHIKEGVDLLLERGN